ncbi:MAG: hypothetical protein BRD55_01505 [Bacteroidetes bacterium SW_9_63_38]|nr:MAG: hypothetical protein BRD55_01505 [Bacteroidetes bacterium SW_9_63_38]
MNDTTAALLHPANLVFLLVVAVAGVGASFWPFPPAGLTEVLWGIGLGLEAAYLGVAPRIGRFLRPVRTRGQREEQGRPTRRDLYQSLPRRSRQRYYRLRTLKADIRTHYAQPSDASRGLIDAHLDRLDRLLRSYLELLWRREQYRVLTERTSTARLREAVETLDTDMEDDAERVQSVKQRRRTVLKKRLERLRTIREHLEVVGAQLGTIEDAVKYIHEQSWTLQDPEEGTTQLETLLEEVDETQRSIRDVERLLSAETGTIDDDLAALDRELRAATGEASDQPDEQASEGAAASRAPE